MPTLHVCFLWHMHQPSYTDPATGEVVMPWVRLHGVKDYTDMAALLEPLGDAHVTFNFVPGLLDQIEAAATAPSERPHDRFVNATLRAPATFDAHTREFITHGFFSVHHPTMLEPHPRYRELHARAQAGDPLGEAELRDLQVWFNLAWCGATVAARPEVAALLARGRDFTEADKATLIAAQRAALAEIVPRYRALADAGRIELTWTPYYHPILPLLVDGDLARAADPATALPATRFRWPGDAQAHVERAVASHTARFGAPACGMWPAEGAVAAPILPLLRDAGVRWIATDETLLRKSLGQRELDPGELLAPWETGGLRIFFRDHGLSDRIGFDYAHWPREEAWADFVRHLEALRDTLDGVDGVVTIALDGENCWEHYPGGSAGFLPGLYRAIAAAPGLRLSTFSEALDAVPARPLDHLAAGSWIDGTYRTWLGDPVKNRAWELMSAARDAVGEPFPVVAARDPELADLILRAEASDWWWWFGEGHSSAFDAEFDALFRAHLVEIYRRIGRAAPAALGQAVSAQIAATPATVQTHRPLRQLAPAIDGHRDWFFKWLSAGIVAPAHGAIHRNDGLLRALTYANDDHTLSLRLDLTQPARVALAGRRLVLHPDGGRSRPSLALWPPAALAADCEAAAAEVFEARVPLAALDAKVHDGALRCRLELRAQDGVLLECFPAVGWSELVLIDQRTSGANRW